MGSALWVYTRVQERGMVDGRTSYTGQYIFHLNPGTLNQLYTLHRVQKVSREFAQPVSMCFVELVKTFKGVPRDILWWVLCEYGVCDPLLSGYSVSGVWFARSKSNLFLVHVAPDLDFFFFFGQ